MWLGVFGNCESTECLSLVSVISGCQCWPCGSWIREMYSGSVLWVCFVEVVTICNRVCFCLYRTSHLVVFVCVSSSESGMLELSCSVFRVVWVSVICWMNMRFYSVCHLLILVPVGCVFGCATVFL